MNLSPGKKLKVLLANPPAREPVGSGRERYFIKAGSRWPWSYIKNVSDICLPPFPFYLAYAAAALEGAGFAVEVIDGVAMNIQEDDFIVRARDIAPDVLVIETVMHAFQHDLRITRELKDKLPDLRVIFCGPFVTVFAEKILRDYPFIDLALRGEYDLTLTEVMKRWRRGEDIQGLAGVAFRNRDEIPVSGSKGFIDDINRLPRPAFKLFPCNEDPDMTRYMDGICTYRPMVTLHSSRGCPFKCDFCLWNQVMYGNGPWRPFDVERIVDEMEYVIREFGAREIYFDDDDFCISKEHVLNICREIRERRMKIKWSCMGDAMVTDEEMIAAMAGAGCVFMKFGVESGNKGVLKKIGKPLDPERAVEVSRWCRKHGIMTHATFVLGLYGDTMATMRDTVRLAHRIKFDYAQVSIATPFPGTRMYDKLLKEGAIKELDYSRFDGAQSCVFNTEALTAEEIEEFRKKTIRQLIIHKMLDPGWWRNYLKRTIILYKEYGFNRAVEPLKALLRL